MSLHEHVAGLLRVDGRVAVVTGASSGLGHRFARVLAAAGADVVASARRTDRLEALAADAGAAAAAVAGDAADADAGGRPGGRIVPVTCDVSVEDDVERLVATALDRFGRIDVLVNNAGMSSLGPAEDEPLDAFRQVVDVNLVGLFHLTRLAARHMLERGSGSIVNITSMLGLVAATPVKQASYCATKGALVNLTRELAVQWARKGVRVNALAPGWFPSELTADMIGDERSEAFVVTNAPMARFGREDELDGALLFLASDASSYVTGQTLVVDGGWTAR